MVEGVFERKWRLSGEEKIKEEENDIGGKWNLSSSRVELERIWNWWNEGVESEGLDFQQCCIFLIDISIYKSIYKSWYIRD